jgi:hypothetical protein
MLVNFFKNIFPTISFINKDNDPISLLYKKLNTLVAKHKDETKFLEVMAGYMNYMPSDILNDCLDKSIINNNLSLTKILYPYLVKEYEINYYKHQGVKFGKKPLDVNYINNHKSVYYYAKVAMKNNRIDLFDYFIKYSKELNRYTSIYCPSEHFKNGSPKGFMVEEVVSSKNINYINILEHYDIFDAYLYLKEHLALETFSGYPLIGSRDITFVLDEVSKSNYSANYLSELLVSVSQHLEKQKLNLEIIKNLLHRGANFCYINNYNKKILVALDEERTFNIVKLLLDDGEYKDIDSLVVKAAQIEDNFSTVRLLLNKGAKINLSEEKVDASLYDFIKKWNNAEELANELNKESIESNAPIIKPKINKI